MAVPFLEDLEVLSLLLSLRALPAFPLRFSGVQTGGSGGQLVLYLVQCQTLTSSLPFTSTLFTCC